MPRYLLQKHLRILKLSRANYMHSDAASQGGGWWQGCGAAYVYPLPSEPMSTNAWRRSSVAGSSSARAPSSRRTAPLTT